MLLTAFTIGTRWFSYCSVPDRVTVPRCTKAESRACEPVPVRSSRRLIVCRRVLSETSFLPNMVRSPNKRSIDTVQKRTVFGRGTDQRAGSRSGGQDFPSAVHSTPGPGQTTAENLPEV